MPIKESLRYLRRNKLYLATSILNISTLLFTAIIAHQYLEKEFSYDSHYSGNVYRVISLNKNTVEWDATSPVRLFDNSYTSTEERTRILKKDAVVLGDHSAYTEENILLVDPEFIDIFTETALHDDVLTDPYSVVITQSTAKKYFGETNPVGQTLKMLLYDEDGEGIEYKITAVLPDQSFNSHINYDFLVSYSTFLKFLPDESGYDLGDNYTYLKLNNPENIESTLNDQLGQHQMDLYVNEFSLQHIEDIHLRSDLENELGQNGSYVQTMGIGLICLMTCLVCIFNFLGIFKNEVFIQNKRLAIKQILGQSNWGTIGYLLVQTGITVLSSLIISLSVILISHELWESLLGIQFNLNSLQTGLTIAAVISVIFTAVIIVLIFFKTLNNKEVVHRGSLKINHTVTAQMTVAVFLLGLSFIIAKQLNFLSSRNLGFETENIVLIKTNGNNEVIRDYHHLRDRLAKWPEVKAFSRSNSSLLGSPDQLEAGTVGSDLRSKIGVIRIAEDFFNIYSIPIVYQSGAFDLTDTTQVFLSEKAFYELFGNTNYHDQHTLILEDQEYMVSAVFKDVLSSRLTKDSRSLALTPITDRFSNILISFTGDPKLDRLNDLWVELFPSAPFDFTMVEDSSHKVFVSHNKNQELVRFLAKLNLLVALLGIFGFISVSVSKSQKEIAIRKIYGADTLRSMSRIMNRALFIFVLANLLAIPLFLYFGNVWLNSFSIRQFAPVETVLLVVVLSFAVIFSSLLIQYFRVYFTDPLTIVKDE